MTDWWRRGRAQASRDEAPTDTSLSIEPGAQVREHICDHCGMTYMKVAGFVHKGDDAYAVYYASCYPHDGNEVWIDATFSPTWADDTDDRITFGTRVGSISGHPEPAASLVQAGIPYPDSRLFGHKLSRDEALTHPLLPEFWILVDHILEHDPVVREHIYD